MGGVGGVESWSSVDVELEAVVLEAVVDAAAGAAAGAEDEAAAAAATSEAAPRDEVGAPKSVQR